MMTFHYACPLNIYMCCKTSKIEFRKSPKLHKKIFWSQNSTEHTYFQNGDFYSTLMKCKKDGIWSHKHNHGTDDVIKSEYTKIAMLLSFAFLQQEFMNKKNHLVITHVTGLPYSVGKPRACYNAATRCCAWRINNMGPTHPTWFLRSKRLCGCSCLSLSIIWPHTVSIMLMLWLGGGQIMCWKACLFKQAMVSLVAWDVSLFC